MAKDKPKNDKTKNEVDLENALRDAGVAIITENGAHEIGETTRYFMVGKDTNSEDEFEALGDDRISALKALLATANAR